MIFPQSTRAGAVGVHVCFGMMQVAAWIDANPGIRLYGVESTVEHWKPEPEKEPDRTAVRSVLVIYYRKGSPALN